MNVDDLRVEAVSPTALDELYEALYQDDLRLIRKAFQDQGCPDDDAIRRLGYRVTVRTLTDGTRTWTLDDTVVLRVGLPDINVATNDGQLYLTYTRRVTFS